jgi:orotidine-5'-phosphate decarboxylase
LSYLQKLEKIVKKNSSNVVIGLDTDIIKIPAFFREDSNPVLEFNKRIISATKNDCAGYKLNMAFYEEAGGIGLTAMKETVRFIPKDMIIICDAKRGDMGNTDEMYAKAYFDNYEFDAITFSPYLGSDSIEPFLKRRGKMVYILALTSNPGSKDLQMLKVGPKYLYEKVIELGMKWGNAENVGFVIGANHPAEIKKVMAKYKNVSLLLPGVGAQKADVKKLLGSLSNKNFVINSSRGIIYAAGDKCKEEDFEGKILDAIDALNETINQNI